MSAFRQAPGFLFQLGLTFLGLLAVTFFIGRVVPIDPVLAVVGDQAPRDVYEQARRELGLDQPLWAQFLIYVRNVLAGEFGQSLVTNRPVIEDIARVFPATLELATFATIIGVVLGVPMGIAGAVWQDRWPDQLVRVVGLVCQRFPWRIGPAARWRRGPCNGLSARVRCGYTRC
ncbi:ABC transporter permease [Leptolyngbya sp. 15MV]|nr:ABC transporter permease [Leptolyngbya sp. 15MV]